MYNIFYENDAYECLYNWLLQGSNFTERTKKLDPFYKWKHFALILENGLAFSLCTEVGEIEPRASRD